MILIARRWHLAALKLSWLGTPISELGGKPIKLEMRKVTALLVYISLEPGAVARESLAAMFWPENDERHALGSLRRALWSLHSSLKPVCFELGREQVGFKEGSGIEIDLLGLQSRLAQVAEHHPELSMSGTESGLCTDCLCPLEEAVA